jgi:hypothetical protein
LKLYEKKHYGRDDNQVEELREPEEECEASDEHLRMHPEIDKG